jgi:hypothetical protein
MPRATNPSNGLIDSWGRKNRRLADRACAQCGKLFRPLRDSSRYCSRPCAWANNGGHNRKSETWWVDAKGYEQGKIWLDEHTQVRVKKHRWLMEQHIGRKLLASEVVHHKDGNKLNNSIDNLELLEHGAHSRHHNKSRIYIRGYKLDLSATERSSRSKRMKDMRAKGQL